MKKYHSIFVFLTVLVLTLPTYSKIFVNRNLVDDFNDIELRINSLANADKAQIRDTLAEIYAEAERIDVLSYQPEQVKKAAPVLIQKSFETRLRLKEFFSQWYSSGRISTKDQSIADLVRKINNFGRYAEEMMGEVLLNKIQPQEAEAHSGVFSQSYPFTLIASGYENFAWQAGDVILMRGNRHNSAAIARIGDTDVQFSHLAIVHKEADQLYLVEALIEKGLVIDDLKEILKKGSARFAVYRFEDQQVAAQAAKDLYLEALEAQQENRIIEYDFSMEMKCDNNKYFCSKAIACGIQKASQNTYTFPIFPTYMTMKNRTFLETLGITVRSTFAPQDVEVDPRFRLIREWKDYSLTSQVRAKDQLASAIFYWMEKYDWKFHEGPIDFVLTFGLKALSYVFGPIQDAIPYYLDRRIVSLMVALHLTAEPVYQDILSMQKSYFSKYGIPMHPREITAFLYKYAEKRPNGIGYLGPKRDPFPPTYPGQ
ncbi:MAG: hypothetical protein KDD40_00525 [Bdellovibrionales bacterium]|nr:hypothetical protein [Bdellovibrionales bacterium]